MLAINPQDVREIIQMAHQFHAKEEVVIPEDSSAPGEDWALQVLADHASDPTWQALKEGIDSLEVEQQITLVALMWLGREDYSADEWTQALDAARDSWTPRTAEYLIGTPLVASYLEAGLEEFGDTPDEE